MGWRINLVKNTVIINEKIAKELAGCEPFCSSEFEEEDLMDYQVGYYDNGVARLHFEPDHMEHMDYVWLADVQKILKKHKVEGDICFSSDDGDNAGKAWGYRFDGKGGMVELEAVRLWKEVHTKTPKKTRTVKKGATPSKTRKVTKPSRGGKGRSTRGKVTWTKGKGKLRTVCMPCYENTALPEKCQFGKPRGMDIRRDVPGEPRYCGTCGESHGLKRIRA